MTGKHRILDETGEMDRVTVPYRQRGQHRQARSVLATLGFVLALVTLPWGWLLFGGPNAAALWVAMRAIKETDKGDRSGFGLAVAGSIIGGIGAVFGVMTMVAVFMDKGWI